MKKHLWRIVRLGALCACFSVFIAAHLDHPSSFFFNWSTRNGVLAQLETPSSIDVSTGMMTWIDTANLIGWWEMDLIFNKYDEIQYFAIRRYVGTQWAYASFLRKETIRPCQR